MKQIYAVFPSFIKPSNKSLPFCSRPNRLNNPVKGSVIYSMLSRLFKLSITEARRTLSIALSNRENAVSKKLNSTRLVKPSVTM